MAQEPPKARGHARARQVVVVLSWERQVPKQAVGPGTELQVLVLGLQVLVLGLQAPAREATWRLVCGDLLASIRLVASCLVACDVEAP